MGRRHQKDFGKGSARYKESDDRHVRTASLQHRLDRDIMRVPAVKTSSTTPIRCGTSATPADE
jgi:hypothetical protein